MKRQFSRAILLENFRMLDSLNKGDVWHYDFENIQSVRISFAKQIVKTKTNLNFVPKQARNNRVQLLHAIQSFSVYKVS